MKNQILSRTHRLILIVLCVWLLEGCDGPKRLILHDFDRADQTNNLGGSSYTWTSSWDDSTSESEFTLVSTERRGNHGNALHLFYEFNPDNSLRSRTGFRTDLNNLDVSDYDHVEFWIKGDKDRGYGRDLRIAFLKPESEFPQYEKSGSYVVKGIKDDWERIRVPLNIMNGIEDWTNLKALIISFHSRRSKTKKGAYYVDEFALIKTGQPGPSTKDEIVTKKKKVWEETLGNSASVKRHTKARLNSWPERLLVDKNRLPKEDSAFLHRLAKDSWNGLSALTDREHGLPLDTVRFSNDSTAPEKSRIGDYTNITNIGLYLLSVVAAADFKYITRQEALEKLTKTFSTLEKMETYNGFYYNYYDTTTLERSSSFISFVDSSWLTAGLMVVRMVYPELHERSTRLIEKGDYGWFYDEVEQVMRHGYWTNLEYPSEYHYGLLYTESRVGSLIAIGKGEVPEEHWFKMLRTFPADYLWQTQSPHVRKRKSQGDIKFTGGYYKWRGLEFVPSWGGSMFEALMPTLVLDEQNYASESLGKNNERHAAIHRRYALKELSYCVWGMSPSSSVRGDNYSEYGVKPLGSRGYKEGVVSPHASALALAVTPKEAVSNLRKLVELYDIYGQFGLYDAVDPTTGEVARKYLALNQAMLFIALANHLNDGNIQKYFANDPIAANALTILDKEHFFD